MNRLRKVPEQHFSRGVGMGTGEESEAGRSCRSAEAQASFPKKGTCGSVSLL